jgi:hypothetical protein
MRECIKGERRPRQQCQYRQAAKKARTGFQPIMHVYYPKPPLSDRQLRWFIDIACSVNTQVIEKGDGTRRACEALHRQP